MEEISAFKLLDATKRDFTQLKNIEINVFVPDLAEINTVAIFIMTDDANFFYSYIGSWELMKGWNKIRRAKSDFLAFGNPRLEQFKQTSDKS